MPMISTTTIKNIVLCIDCRFIATFDAHSSIMTPLLQSCMMLMLSSLSVRATESLSFWSQTSTPSFKHT